MSRLKEMHWSSDRIRESLFKVGLFLFFLEFVEDTTAIVTRGSLVYVFRMLPPIVIVVLSSVAVLLLNLREAAQRVALSMSGL